MSRNPRVDAFLLKKKHPLNEQIQMVREIILKVDDKIQEDIKWQSPIFMYKGNMASIQMNAKKFVSVMFHKGVLIKDNIGLLEGNGTEVRVARFMDVADIKKKEKALESVVKEWIVQQDKTIG
jgi:uncharacterized protein YdeI (YjbR/CyaY-like superfamily)